MAKSSVETGPGGQDVRRQPGRPRDEAIDSKVRKAAMEVYALRGWEGFNFQAVANAAGVGRPSLYRRWPDPSSLLIDAFVNTSVMRDDFIADSLYQELLRFITVYRQTTDGTEGRAGERLWLDRHAIPDVFELIHRRILGVQFDAVCESVRRAEVRNGRKSALSDRIIFAFLIGGTLPSEMTYGGSEKVPLESVVEAVITLIQISD